MQQEAVRALRQLKQTMEYYKAQGNSVQAANVAKKIMELEPRTRQLCENIVGVFIDAAMPVEALRVLDFLEKHWQSRGFWQVLRAKIAYLQKDYASVRYYGKAGLQDKSLTAWQIALCYNVLATTEANLGNVELAAGYALASSELANNPGALLEYSTMLFYLHYLDIPQSSIYQAITGYNSRLSNIIPYMHTVSYHHQKIRVGYVSADLRYSVVALFTFAMLTTYDKSRFRIYAYAKGSEDDVSQMIKDHVDVWRNITQLSTAEVAARIKDDEIDILFEPAGHTANNCLEIMAYKPAPIQMCGIGWFDTTGMQAIDYFLTDIYVDPPGKNDEYFSEKLIRLPHSHFCYYLTQNLSNVYPLPFLVNGYITFGTLNKFAKFTDKMLSTWAEILRQVPTAKLFLKGDTYDTELGCQTAYQRLQSAGISVNRVILEGRSNDYLQAYGKIDIALDTFPYPGGTTTCDAIFSGVPVVTLVGQSHNSRFGYSLLKNMQLEELCATSPQEYIEISVSLAKNTDRLLTYRQTLQRRMQQSPLMDAGLYMTELEQIYEGLVRKQENSNAVSQDEIAKLERHGDWDHIIIEVNKKLALGQYEEKDVPVLWGWLGQAYMSSQRYQALDRAKYCLQKAIAFASMPHKLYFLCYLCEVAEKTEAYALQHKAAREALDLLNQYHIQLPQGWESNLHVICAHSALLLGYFAESEKEYLLGSNNKSTLREKLDIMTSYVLASHYQDYSSQEIWQRQQKYAELINQIKPLPPLRKGHRKGDKIRIGYISPNFHRHAMFPIIQGLFNYCDRERFYVVGYQLNSYIDDCTQELRQSADKWKDVSRLSHKDIAILVRNDNIDILVDLASHLAGTGLPVLAYRPARVHISGLGSICTTGVSAVDYYLTDKIVDPPGWHDEYFAETPLYLPAQFPYSGVDAPLSQGAPCCKRGYIQFGVFQLFTKVTDEMLLVWKKILMVLPTSRLLFKGASFNDNGMIDVIYDRLRKLGMPMERIIMEGSSQYAEYMQRLLDIDIMLDTYPYTGGSTTLDALYMGVPTVTFYGERRGTRFGYSVLNSVGLEDLAANTKDGYIQRVLSLAADKELLDLLHKNLRQMMLKSEMLSPEIYVNHLERLYMQVLDEGE